MAAVAGDPALVAALLAVLGASIAAVRYGHWPEVEDVARPWAPRGWRRALTVGEQEEAHTRAMGVARLTLGEEIWVAFVRDGYVDLPSAAEPGTHYRLRPARRVEIWEGLPATDLQGCGGARAYLCVYPAYELPAVEFMAQLYLRLRDDEERALATGRLQSSDGRISNVF